MHRRYIREALITEFLTLRERERFTCEGSLVDRDIDSLNETAVSGDGVINLEGDHVAEDELPPC